MAGAKKNFIGQEGFFWWIGVVEDRQDPEQLGRVRVRCFGYHTENKEKIPTDNLPWAHIVVPTNTPAAYTPKEGDMVVGFFMDGAAAQNPVVMGVLPGKPGKKPNYENGFSDPRKDFGSAPKKPDDSAEAYPKGKYLKESTFNRLSRGKEESTIIATRKKNRKKSVKSAGGVTWDEPSPNFGPKYPYNYAIESESGHAIELDDTPGKERIQFAHRNGSYIEVDKDGNRLERIQKDHYTITMGSDHVYISGKCSVTIDGDYNIRVGGNMNVEVAGQINMVAGNDIRIKGKDNYIESVGKTNIKSTDVANISSGQKLSLRGATAALQGATVDIPAAQINMQSGSSTLASGTGLSGGGSSAITTEAAEAANASANTASSGGTGLSGNIAGVLSGQVANVTAVVANTAAAATSAAQGAANAAGSVASAAAGAANAATSAANAAGGLLKNAIGKVVDGITSVVSAVTQTITSTIETAITSITGNNMPLGEMQAKVTAAETAINDNRGQILGLDGSEKKSILGKIDSLVTQATQKNLEINIDVDISKEIDKLKSTTAPTVAIAKHVYPKTETVVVNTTSSNT